jgi:hypothetical protein
MQAFLQTLAEFIAKAIAAIGISVTLTVTPVSMIEKHVEKVVATAPPAFTAEVVDSPPVNEGAAPSSAAGGRPTAGTATSSPVTNQPAPVESMTKPADQTGQVSRPDNGGVPPQEAIAACVDHKTGDQCQFANSDGVAISGICDTLPGASLSCAPL